MKKTLIMKFAIDLGQANDTQIDLMKAAILAGYSDEQRKHISFEMLVDDEQEQSARMMQHVRSEFRKRDK